MWPMDGLSMTGPGDAVGLLAAVFAIVGVASSMAAAISKLTKNTADDKIADALRKVHDFLAKLGLQGASLNTKRVGSALEAADLAETVKVVPPVRDHRTPPVTVVAAVKAVKAGKVLKAVKPRRVK